MKYLIIFELLFFISTISAQKSNSANIFKEYLKHNNSFDNPKIKEFSSRYANLYNDFCTEKITSVEFVREIKILNRLYDVYFVNISDNDKANLMMERKLIHADGEAYLKEVSYNRTKISIKKEFKKQNKELYDRVKNATILFKNKHFEKFANEMQGLVFKQCSTKMPQDEYSKKSLKIRAKYVKWFKDVSSEDIDNLILLYDATENLWTSIDEVFPVNFNGIPNATYYDVNVTYQASRPRAGVAFEQDNILELHLNIPEQLQGQGVGTEVFIKSVKDYSPSKVKGWWKESDIYTGGESVNLTIFKQKLDEGLSPIDAAFETPSGKIFKRNGFNGVPEIIKNTPEEVIIHFNPTN